MLNLQEGQRGKRLCMDLASDIIKGETKQKKGIGGGRGRF